MNDIFSESQARAAARRAGYVARKSRWRRGTIDNYGGFMLVDPITNFAVAGFRYDLDPDDVIAFLHDEDIRAYEAAGGEVVS